MSLASPDHRVCDPCGCRPDPVSGLSRLAEIERIVEDALPKVTSAAALTQGLRADFDVRTANLEKIVKSLQVRLYLQTLTGVHIATRACACCTSCSW